MPDICTCGATLPPDARFCHICGKPQREELVMHAAAQEAAPAPVIAAAPTPISALSVNFHNPVAVRVGLMMAAFASLLSCLPYLSLGFVIWWVSAGFFSVYVYRRRTGQLLTIGSGMRLGWITGVLTFVMMTVLFTMTLVPLSLRKGGLAGVYQDQLRNMPMSDPNMQQALKIFDTPGGLAAMIGFTLACLFAIIILLCAAGGALGAKISGRE
jgi:hypothetical protein